MISRSDFIRFETPPGLLKIAAVKDLYTKPFTNSATDNERRTPAFAAEIAIANAIDVPLVSDTETRFDLIYNGYKCDVKTMERSYRPYDGRLPSLEWECNVHVRNYEHQKSEVEYYLFADTNRDGSVLIFTGYIAKSDFDRFKVLHKKGTLKNPKAKESFWTEDTYSVAIKHLSPYDPLISAAIKNAYLKG